MLHGLPLALTLAGSFIHSRGCSFAQYNERYNQQWPKLLHLQDKSLPPEYRRPMLTTWSIAYTQVKNRSENAAALLDLWSFFHNADLHYSLLQPLCETVQGHEAIGYMEPHTVGDLCPSWLKSGTFQEDMFQEEMAVLIEHSLASEGALPGTYIVHPVIHEWCFQSLHQQGSKTRGDAWITATLVLRALQNQFPEGMERVKLCTALLPHAIQVYRRFDQCIYAQNDNAELDRNVSSLLIIIGQFHFDGQRVPKGTAILNRALPAERALLKCSPDSLDIAMTLSQLIRYLGLLALQRGEYSEAEILLSEALQRNEEFLGPSDLKTLYTVRALGRLHLSRLRFQTAETLYWRALQGLEDTLGTSHEATHRFILDLGKLFICKGELDKAEEWTKRSLHFLITEPGSSSWLTQRVHWQLGIVYLNQRKFEQAETHIMLVVEERGKALGETHAETLRALFTYGQLCIARKALHKGLESFKTVIKACETSSLRGEHLKTWAWARALSGIARVRVDEGSTEAAEHILKRISMKRPQESANCASMP